MYIKYKHDQENVSHLHPLLCLDVFKKWLSNIRPWSKTGGPGCNNICVLWMYICALQYMFGCNKYIYIHNLKNIYIYIYYIYYLLYILYICIYLNMYIYICFLLVASPKSCQSTYISHPISQHICVKIGCFCPIAALPSQLGPPTRDTSDPCSCVGHILVTHVGQSVPVDGIQKRRLADC